MPCDIKEPMPATLRKYGLSVDEWRALLERQGGVCFVCEREPESGKLRIDHDHVKRWKKLPPAKRKLYVRGLLCWTCNKYYVGRAITVARAKNVVSYLEAYARGEALKALDTGAFRST